MRAHCNKAPALTGCALALLIASGANAVAGQQKEAKKKAPLRELLFAPHDVVVWKGSHRIPGIVLTNKGTLVAFTEFRHTSSDLGNNDLVCKRSTDGGKTWGKEILIHEEGGNKSISIGDQCAVVDRKTGTIWCFFARNKKAPLYLTGSEDDGVTWKKPAVVTKDVSGPEWLKSGNKYWFGPGHGIQLRSGRLLIPAFHVERLKGDGKYAKHHAHVVYSDDHGKSWKVGGTVGGRPRTCEPRVIEFPDGSLYMNTRCHGRRAYSWSRDGGLTWTDAKCHPMLTEPKGNGCDGSVVLLTDSARHDKSRVLYSGPSDPKSRRNLAVHISYDRCRTWKMCRLIKKGRDSYSDMVVFPDLSVGCLYETNDGGWQSIRFARFTLEWLTGGKDKLDRSRFKAAKKAG
jgi:sialidase-1